MAMFSKRSQEGYLMIDNRNSPGVSDEFIARTGKKNVVSAKPGMLFEVAVTTCPHCTIQVIRNPDRTRERGYCFKCDHYICDHPRCRRECFPAKKILDLAEAKAFRNLVCL